MSLVPSQTARQEALMEFSALGQANHCPLGMYIWPTEVFRWSGVLFIHQGYYASSVLHFTLSIPASYPSKPPSVTFDSPVFHPLVDPVSGRMRLDARFPHWRPREDFIWSVLHFVKGAFKRRALDELREAVCANPEAYRLYRNQTPLFAQLAAQSAALSCSSSVLYAPPPSRSADPNPSAIRFRKLKGEEEDELRSELRTVGERKVVKKRTGTGTAGIAG
ncbi:SPOSA6832_00073 [Sporobolomyces salmonicolor]|uniref:SPOSA6832_00073-mRNA-1:cds n=1 Tax=Sporidiobolus salmonicolor TaxID=5005 RepID=A0A0D6EFE7_SPOSA|nr:SPOSA6832_00073 [Sporobolomyces salmonicolor]